MRKVAIVFFTLIVFAGLASAQVPTSGNIFVGYSFYSASPSSLNLLNVGRPNMNGWDASLEGKVLPWVGIVADISGHYGSHTLFALTPIPVTTNVTGHETDVMFGPRLSFPIGKFRPFGEAMFGIGHVSIGGLPTSDTSLATAVGGGLDYKIVRILALRAEADYVQTRFFHTRQDNFRLSTGIVFRF